MKKNGKKYRKLQKEKELKEINNFMIRKNISQEVADINIAWLTMSHIIPYNPIIYDSLDVREEYLKRLNTYIRAGGWNRRKYEKAELLAYEAIVLKSETVKKTHDISFYQYYILFDLMHVLGYELKNQAEEKINAVKKKYFENFLKTNETEYLIDQIFESVQGSVSKLKQLEEHKMLKQEADYIRLIRENLLFMKRKPLGIVVTATMSAGKSTFINALTGKYICLSQNMACTSKIHCILNKAFEDGFSYEYDHDLVMIAGREELLNDNEQNVSDKIIVSTHFDGFLKKQRLIISDSPGVNFSGDEHHKEITDQLIKRRNFNLLIYVMNATQLATNDEDEHLEYIKQSIGRTPVIFVMNKIDAFNVDEENVETVITNQIEYLKRKGFKNPIVCPVSSRAGYLSKQFTKGGLSRTEKRELYNYVDKFEKMRLTEYYARTFKNIRVHDFDSEEEQLLKTSGIAFVEKIIVSLATGGKINGTGIR